MTKCIASCGDFPYGVHAPHCPNALKAERDALDHGHKNACREIVALRAEVARLEGLILLAPCPDWRGVEACERHCGALVALHAEARAIRARQGE